MENNNFKEAQELQDKQDQLANGGGENLINKYVVLWCDGKVDSFENKMYRDRLNVHSYCQWEYISNVPTLMDRLDDPATSSNVIIICSGSLSEDIISQT